MENQGKRCSLHTMGPWKANTCEIFTDDGKASKRIGFATGKGNGDNNEFKEVEANARLMALAPELLHALEDVYKNYEGHLFKDHGTHPLYWAGLVLAKARGK